MQNGLFTLDFGGIADAALTAAGAAVFVALYGIVTTPGFDVLAVHWTTVGHQALNLSIVAAFVSLGKDFLSTSKGSVLGITPEVTG